MLRKKKAKSGPTNSAQTNARKRWTKDELNQIASYVVDKHKEGRYNRKDIKGFMEKMHVDLSFTCTAKQLRNCYEKLEGKYKQVHDWLQHTGSGLIDSDPDSIEAYIAKHCPQYKILEEVFETRNDINPPYIHDTEVVDRDREQAISSDEIEQDVQIYEEVPAMTLNAAGNSFQASLKDSVAPPTKKSKTARFTADLDDYMQRKVCVDEQRLQLDQKKYDDELHVRNANEHLKLQIEKDKIAMQKQLSSDQEKLALKQKILEMQQTYDLELLKLGRQPDPTYSVKLMEAFNLTSNLQGANGVAASSFSDSS